MIKIFIVGVVLGAGAVVGVLFTAQPVDQAREASIISVAPNGGITESFHVNVPMDRIMVGAQGRDNPLPENMIWPEDELLAGARTELFKLRNARDAVVGVASRFAVDAGDAGQVIEWILHLPARGTLYVTMNNIAANGRVGEIRAGTREFEPLLGRMSERWVADANSDIVSGRIELVTRAVSSEEPELNLGEEPDEEAEE